MFAFDSMDAALCSVLNAIGVDCAGGKVTWYQLLGCSPQADIAALTGAWNRSRAIIEDQVRADAALGASAVLQQLDRALSCLTQPQKRAEYDKYLAVVRRENGIGERRQNIRKQYCERVDADLNAMTRSDEHDAPQKMSARSRFEPLEPIDTLRHDVRIFKAYDFLEGRTVAVRCLCKAHRTQSGIAAFLDESRTLSAVSHPQIAEVHAIDEEHFFCVQEYLPESAERSVALGIARSGLSAAVGRFLVQALMALQRLHDRGLIHGRLTADSFRSNGSTVVKLVDLPHGSACADFAADDRRFLPPLHVSADCIRAGRATVQGDLYALGYLTLELMAGPLLPRWFPSNFLNAQASPERWRQWHEKSDVAIPPLEVALPQLDPRLAFTIQALCNKRPEDRLAKVSDALALLRLGVRACDRTAAAAGQRAHTSEVKPRASALSGSGGSNQPRLGELADNLGTRARETVARLSARASGLFTRLQGSP